ncbi:13688_t:CDS:2 [Funneliformis mosseae]|uniref:13688_t:CDS:1 n=1 Tax=Funneliformis mosseae TaxID=27381 RepID=A0A9N9GH63_FUNMO|nr:13688_t:CDS:2 [Funneliformis mosseae]
MVQRCCCFIKLRTGAILISLLVLAQSFAGAYVAFSFVDAATKFSRVLGYFHGVWNIIRGVIALGGLFGAITQNQKLIKYFAVIVSASAMFYLVFGISISIISIKNKDTLVDMCVQKFNEQAQEGNYWSPVSHWMKPYEKRQEASANSTDNANFTNDVIPQNTQSERELCQQGFYFASVLKDFGNELKKADMLNYIKEDERNVIPKPPPRGISSDN